MTSEKKQIRSTQAQINKLVDYMSTNQVFANGEFTGPMGSQQIEAQWKDLKALLKEHGPDKTIDQWKQTWRDLKRKARRSNAEATQARAQTGNTHNVPTVSESASKILDTIGHECSTGIGPDESHIGHHIVPIEAANIPPSSMEYELRDDVISIEVPITRESFRHVDENVLQNDNDTSPCPINVEAQSGRRHHPSRRTPRRRRLYDEAQQFAQLHTEHNNILNKIFGQMEVFNRVLTEHSVLMRQQNEIQKRQCDILEKMLKGEDK